MNMHSGYRPNETPRGPGGNGDGHIHGFSYDETGHDPGRASSAAGQVSDASIGTLLRELAHEVPALLTKEVALAKTEMRENLRETREGVAAVATGGAVTLAGLVVVLMAVVYGLSNVMAPWLAALVVGAAAMLIGFGMMSAGKKKFDSDALRPDRTVDSLRKDKNAIKGGHA
ncbi:MAG TPA: phage holin family protein [Lysobacter sp.]